MKNNKEELKKWLPATIVISTATIALVVAFALHINSYKDRVLPNVYIADINVGGLDKKEAHELISNKYNELISAGITVQYDGKKRVLPLEITGTEDIDVTFTFVDYDIDKAVNDAYSIGRNHGRFGKSILFARQLLSPFVIENTPQVIESRIISLANEAFPEIKASSKPTKISFNGNELEVEAGKQGIKLDERHLMQAIAADIRDLKLETINLPTTDSEVPVQVEDLRAVSNELSNIQELAPITLSFTDEYGRSSTWSINLDLLGDILTPLYGTPGTEKDIKLNDELFLTIDSEALNSLYDDIRSEIDINPIDGVFEVTNGKVTRFVPSQDGIVVNEESTTVEIANALKELNDEVEVIVRSTPPEIRTEDTNDYGIKEVIGIGTSDFSGSPNNRIANIRHGASKLDGLLIAPEETISLVETLKPFTVADGYLPELVIKGDEITPEVGGGLCQIGTTTFRGVMNSGLKVDERRNHSLVVSYYNDPSNNNPGTDATIYDPAPDFKFTNDTDHHILLTTDVNVYNGILTFTFWGTDDGRTGYYTPPKVISRTAPGPTKYIETTDLPPGKEECQGAHVGMQATFDYIVESPDGEKQVTTYDSTYRPLPRICLVGVNPDAKAETESSESETTTEESESSEVETIELNLEEPETTNA